MMYCGLCKIKVKDWKIHTAGSLHRKNLERASRGELGIASGMVANKILAKEAMDRMDESFRKLEKQIKEKGA